MRTSVITRFAKNTRSLSTRRRIAALATTVVLAGGIQALATDTAWACGDDRITGPHQVAPGTADASPDAAFVATPSSAVADGSWNEVTLKVTNRTGVDAHGMEPFLTVYTPGSGDEVAVRDVRMQFLDYTGTWKDLRLIPNCYREVEAAETQRARLDNGQSATFKFRFSLSPSVSGNVAEIDLLTSANRAGNKLAGGTDLKPVKLAHAQDSGPAAAKPTQSAKPAPAKTAKPAKPAKPAADETKAAAPAAPAAPAAEAPKSPVAAPTTAPATTAPDGATELAHTGSSSANGFLAGSAAALLALGAGVLIAVRRLRTQR
ncbi:LAETG motif-containing sortase-dependent surface protein [Kitasatospora sp. NPDC048722]|uniref:LAETG motif-containing sortase-dependent surface protein n=1 Tax=Kitasatospora sp. NPDC048722 TaxID=3155639 RepID=UPI00340D6305